MDRYAVIGNPVAHSRSPQIHRLFAEQTGEKLTYEALECAEGEFEQTVREFAAEGGKGMNVTLPFKLGAFALCSGKNEAAELSGAVNTLSFAGDKVLGGNTDGAGLLHDLKVNHQIELTGKTVLVLGAGGAARGIMKPLLDEKPAEVVVCNRLPYKPEEFRETFGQYGPVQPCTYLALKGHRADVIINATSASVSGVVPQLPDNILVAGGVCYDLYYSKTATAFQQWAAEQGASKNLDGLGMLVEQAAESFNIWRGVRPETAAVLQALREELSS